MRDIKSIANQCTDDIFDETSGTFNWDIIERRISEVLTEERERAAALATFYKNEILAKAITDGAFVSPNSPREEWWV